jgi:lipoprotein NlpD
MFDKQIGLILCVAVVMAGCSGSRVPAPVEQRTSTPIVRTPAPPPAPAARAPAPSAPAAAPAPAPANADNGVTVQTAPARGSSVEVRPLDGRAPDKAGPAAPAVTPPPVGSAPAGSISRSQPRGFKRPYSDAVLAELVAAESAPAAPAAPATAAAGTAAAGTAAGATAAAKPDAAKADAPKADSAKPDDSRADASRGGDGFVWPAAGKVTQGYSEPKSMGISIEGKSGDPVLAAGDGRVIFSGPGPRGYGNLLIVKHDADTVSVYAHNKALLVKEGQSVKRGQRVAELGDSGTDKPKLHFEIRKQGKPVDPQKFLPKR